MVRACRRLLCDTLRPTLATVAAIGRRIAPLFASGNVLYDRIQIEVDRNLRYEELLNLVDAGEIDMAAIIRPPFSLHSDLRWHTLAHEPFRLLVPRHVEGDHWADLLSSQPFVRYDRASFGGRQVDRFLRSAHLSVQQVCELDELDAIVRLVANGVGIALVPQTATHRRWPAAVRAIDLGPHTFHRDIGLVHRASRSLSEPARVLAQLVCNAYSGKGAWGDRGSPVTAP